MAGKNHIEQLIQDLCPSGVDTMTLGELLDYEQPTKYIVESTEYDDNYPTPVLTAGQSFILGYTDETEGIYEASKEHPTIIFDDFTTSYHWVEFDFKVKSSAMKMLRPRKGVKVNFRYIYYAMLGIEYVPEEHTRQWISRYSEFKIPVPPRQIQDEIVDILDVFARLLDNIDTEIQARYKQLEDARAVLLENVDKEEYSKPLGKICKFPKDRISASELNYDNYVGVENLLQKKQGITRASVLPMGNAIKFIEGDVLIGNIRPNLRKIWLADRTGGTNGDVVTLRRREEFWDMVETSYLYHVLADERFFLFDIQFARGAKMPRGNKEKIMEYPIPVPPIAEQRAIAEKLDTIEAFINNLKTERDLRQQQYEYYREHLINLLK